MAEGAVGEGVRPKVKAIGGENIWVEFAGHKNTEYGVELLSMPTRPHPARKGDSIDIPGRDGKLFMDEGAYDRVLVSLRMIATSGSMDAVNAWLSGSGNLRFGDDPNRAYRAMITKEFATSNRNNRLNGREFTVTFDCEPFRYVYPDSGAVAIAASGDTITNPGTVYSLPRIKVTGNGDFTMTVNGYLIEAQGLTGGAIIDCELQEVLSLDGMESRNAYFAMDEFPRLSPGINAVTWTGSVTSVQIEPRWRYL